MQTSVQSEVTQKTTNWSDSKNYYPPFQQFEDLERSPEDPT